MGNRLLELAGLFLKLGTIGFGGPAVHIATMEEEVVHRRGWMTHEHFLDLVGATNLIPGPNSTEMAIHIGYHRAGIAGLAVAGVAFVGPAVLVTTLFAWLYVHYGSLPNIEPMLSGVKPAVLAIIASAGWRLARKAINRLPLAIIALAVGGASLAGFDQVIALLVGGIVGMIWLRLLSKKGPQDTAAALVAGAFGAGSSASAATISSPIPLATTTALAATAPIPLWKLGLFFLKVGAVLYGSGYVLIAYLEGGIEPGGPLEGVLSEQGLLDAVAIGQFTPGPILSTATFIGYLVAGLPGAVVATLGIFLPSFFFVAILNPIVPRLRKSPWTAAFLDAVVAASMGLLAAVTVELCYKTLWDAPTLWDVSAETLRWSSLAIAAIALLLALRWKLSPAWLVLFGAVAGLVLSWIG